MHHDCLSRYHKRSRANHSTVCQKRWGVIGGRLMGARPLLCRGITVDERGEARMGLHKAFPQLKVSASERPSSEEMQAPTRQNRIHFVLSKMPPPPTTNIATADRVGENYYEGPPPSTILAQQYVLVTVPSSSRPRLYAPKTSRRV
jgi:hypothetical protein